MTEVTVAEALAETRARWDARARIHVADRTGFYGVEAFLAGDDSLDAVEAGDLGPLDGLRIAHLQCHFGLDTLKLLRLGAAEAAGVDYSAVAIEAARDLAARAGLDARFVEADVVDAPAHLGAGAWDLVYVTWGTICWLPDLPAWARAVAALLAPGGRLFFRDAHPFLQTLELVGGELKPLYRWRTPAAAPLRFEAEGTYTGDGEALPGRADSEWIHPVSDIVGALLSAGLRIDGLEEGESLPWDFFPGFGVEDPRGVWRLPEAAALLPQSLTVRASKPV